MATGDSIEGLSDVLASIQGAENEASEEEAGSLEASFEVEESQPTVDGAEDHDTNPTTQLSNAQKRALILHKLKANRKRKSDVHVDEERQLSRPRHRFKEFAEPSIDL